MNEILIVTPYFRPAKLGGGSQISIENLVDALSTDFKVTVVCLNRDFGQNEILTNSYIRVENNIKILYWSNFNFYKILKHFFKSNFKKIYINSFFSPLCIFLQIIYKKNKNIIISPKGEFFESAISNKKFKKHCAIFLIKFIFKKRTFHATSNHEVASIVKYFPNNKIIVANDIPISIDNITFHQSRTTKTDIFRIIFSSRIVRNKNLIFLPKILKHLTSKIEFDIYGDIYDLKYYNEVEKELNKLPNNITWNYCGRLDFNDAQIIFSKYDLFVFPTLGENFGFVILESLSCGCPILLSNNTTPWNELEKNGVGYNLDLNNDKIWADKIKYYIALSCNEKVKISSLCKDYAQQKTNIKKIINENLQMFKSN